MRTQPLWPSVELPMGPRNPVLRGGDACGHPYWDLRWSYLWGHETCDGDDDDDDDGGAGGGVCGDGDCDVAAVGGGGAEEHFDVNGDDDAYDDSYVHESNVDYYDYFHLLIDVQSICSACDDCDYFVD